VRELALACGVPLTLSALKVPRAALPRLAEAAVGVTRLLKNNPREVTLADAVAVYEQAY
jgi:alcohol dehydrogenase class IV